MTQPPCEEDGVCRTYAEKNICSPESPEEQAEQQRCGWKVVRMGGKGRLTDVVMKLQKFYGKAIRSNVGDAKSMQDAVMAIYYHSNVGDAKSIQDAVMAIYYHSNVGDAKSMQDAVMAIYYHSNVGDAKSMQGWPSITTLM